MKKEDPPAVEPGAKRRESLKGSGPPISPLPREHLREAMAVQFVEDATGGVAGHPVAGVVALVLFMDLAGARASLVWFGILLAATAFRVVSGIRAKKAAGDPGEARRIAFMGAWWWLRPGAPGASSSVSACLGTTSGSFW